VFKLPTKFSLARFSQCSPLRTENYCFIAPLPDERTRKNCSFINQSGAYCRRLPKLIRECNLGPAGGRAIVKIHFRSNQNGGRLSNFYRSCNRRYYNYSAGEF